MILRGEKEGVVGMVCVVWGGRGRVDGVWELSTGRLCS